MQDQYAVSSNYSGPRVFQVPVRMYSRNSLMGAMHIKSKRYLSVDLDRSMFTFHKSRDPKDNKDKTHEIAFSKLVNVETDVSKAADHKYYMTVNTNEGELRFKFANAQDFHQVADALANVTHSGKAVHQVSDQYKKFNNDYSTNKATYVKPATGTTTATMQGSTTTNVAPTGTTGSYPRSGSASSISSDDAKDYNYEDEARDRVKKSQKWSEEERKERENNAKDAQKDYQKMGDRDLKDAEKNAKDYNKDQETYTKDAIDRDEKYAQDQQKSYDEQNTDASKYARDNISDQADRARDNVGTAADRNDKAIGQNYDAARDANKN